MPVLVQNAVADHKGLMWPLFVIVTAITSTDAIELPEAEAEEVIKTFGLKVSDITFNDRIHFRGAYASSDDCLLCF